MRRKLEEIYQPWDLRERIERERWRHTRANREGWTEPCQCRSKKERKKKQPWAYRVYYTHRRLYTPLWLVSLSLSRTTSIIICICLFLSFSMRGDRSQSSSTVAAAPSWGRSKEGSLRVLIYSLLCQEFCCCSIETPVRWGGVSEYRNQTTRYTRGDG